MESKNPGVWAPACVTSVNSTGMTITQAVPVARVPRGRLVSAGPDSTSGTPTAPGAADMRCCGARFIAVVVGRGDVARPLATITAGPATSRAAIKSGRALPRRVTARSYERFAI